MHENIKIMINLIRLSDDTDHGGKVTTASPTMRSTTVLWQGRAMRYRARNTRA